MTVLADLARWAGSEPEDPWLFFRRDWDWKWRSWGQVADQVARGAVSLRRSPGLGAPAGVRMAFDPRQDPDAIAAGLAVRAAGATAVPRSGGRYRPLEVTVLEDGEPSASLRLPACRSRLERWDPQSLDVETAETEGESTADAGRLERILPVAGGGSRPILCASASLDARTVQVLQAWTLRSGAAWILEPDVEAFVATAQWSRPTLVVAGGQELAILGLALGERKSRRRQRLMAAVSVGGYTPSEAWEELGVPVVELDP